MGGEGYCHVTKRRSRATREPCEFSSEGQLVAHLVRSRLRRLLKRPGSWRRKLWQEVNVGEQIPDIVLVSRPTSSRACRQRLTALDTVLLGHLLRNHHVRIGTLVRVLFAPKITINLASNRLQKSGLVRRKGSLLTARYRRYLNSFRVVAIEAKLNRCTEALRQAARYRAFAHLVYLAIPATVVRRRPRVVRDCRAGNVGLITVSRKGARVVFRPRLSVPKSSEWLWVAAKTWGL
jgi:predicted transcriptional regulator